MFLRILKARHINPNSALNSTSFSHTAVCKLSKLLKHRVVHGILIHTLPEHSLEIIVLTTAQYHRQCSHMNKQNQSSTVNLFSKINMCSPRSNDNKTRDNVSELKVVFHLDIFPPKQHSWTSSAAHLGS